VGTGALGAVRGADGGKLPVVLWATLTVGVEVAGLSIDTVGGVIGLGMEELADMGGAMGTVGIIGREGAGATWATVGLAGVAAVDMDCGGLKGAVMDEETGGFTGAIGAAILGTKLPEGIAAVGDSTAAEEAAAALGLIPMGLVTDIIILLAAEATGVTPVGGLTGLTGMAAMG
jgi:hypothetical protein